MSSCELAKLNDPIIVPDVEDEFYIDWREKLSGSSRSLDFMIRTIKEDQCPDAAIAYDLIRYSFGFQISLNDITSNDHCDAKMEPAAAEISLGRIATGTYQLKIDLKKSVKNEGSLKVNSDHYALSMQTEDGIQVLNNVLYKVPEHTVWGYVNYANPEDETIAAAFVEETGQLSVEKSFPSGYYGHFRIGINGQVALPEQPVSARLKTFIFSIPDQREALTELIERFRSEHGQQLEIYLLDDKGRLY